VAEASDVRLEIFMTTKINIMVLWVMTLCGDMVGCQPLGGPCCLHLQVEDRGSVAS
jgi:hypothetical protein